MSVLENAVIRPMPLEAMLSAVQSSTSRFSRMAQELISRRDVLINRDLGRRFDLCQNWMDRPIWTGLGGVFQSDVYDVINSC